MSVEILEPHQPWPIYLPEEPSHFRPLEARNADGAVTRRWRYNHGWEIWQVEGKTWGNGWTEIVRAAMMNGWTLTSLPTEDAR